ncbi:uncharacterized protein DSM5745_02514 [Aspergillus mulundensis]|uniref:Uncharacterized protein n=1 Tax=Aspergillus mulundensis TaxID=1810919 RepID=A0A3D8SWV5_9EURO|nr:Uncharacterized protein DSM5745_02514 [Aspergillus mulundensis]RDW90739.1 Uncharacterized protein DSM5745_02514 [Aspergillus mulundensis]
MPSLPPELILLIVEALIPSSPPIFPPGHAVTRTLLSLTLTCKLTHRLAQELLFTHCLHLNSGKRIHDAVNQSSLCKISPHGSNKVEATRARSLFLAFPSAPTLNLNSTDTQIIQLLSTFNTEIRRLVIDLPLRNLIYDNAPATYDDSSPQREITRAICRLKAVEEFCCQRDGLGAAPYRQPWLDTYEIHLWTLDSALLWSRLRRLALCNPSFDSLFIFSLRFCRNLTHLAFTCPATIEEEYEESQLKLLDVDVAQTWSALERVLIIQGDGPLETTERWDFWENRLVRQHSGRGNWGRSFLGTLMLAVQNAARSRADFRPELVYIDAPKTAQFDAEDYATFQEWTGARALDGSLWEYPGLVYDVDAHGGVAAAMVAGAGGGSPVYQPND